MSRDRSSLQKVYGGRWVALLGERVVGQGGTPQQALHAAQATRHKERPEVIFVSTNNSLNFSPILEQVQSCIPASADVYLVGGAVRDAILQRPSHDLDFAVKQDALKLARKVADKLQGAYYKLDDEHPTGRVILTDAKGMRFEIDFAEFRGASLEDDLRGRDLTINAMAVHLHKPQELLDPLGGLNDLWNKQIRHCSETSFTDDPVRTLRAVRFIGKFNFVTNPETKELIKQAVEGLSTTSAERIRDELFKILATPKPITLIRVLDTLGILKVMLPELPELRGVTQSPPHISDVWTHTLHTQEYLLSILSALDPSFTGSDEGNLATGMISSKLGRYRTQLAEHLQTNIALERSYRALLLFAGLYHDSGKPHTKEVEADGRIRFFNHEVVGAELVEGRGQLLNLSNSEIDRAVKIVRHHMRPHLLANEPELPSRKAVYRFFRDTGVAGIDICLLSLADLQATYGHTLDDKVLGHHLAVLRTLLDAYYENYEAQISPPTLLDGNDLMREFKLEPGPKVGKLIELIREAQAVGDVVTKGDALELVEKNLSGN